MSSSPVTQADAARDDASAAATSKKLLRRLAKAQYRAQQKAERAVAVANGEDTSGTHRQRKRRSKRDCNRQGILKRLAAADAPDRDGDAPEIKYIACTSKTCGSGGSCRLRIVAPYIHRFETFVKARWCGRTLIDVFLHEFAGLPAEYCQAAISMGLIRINGQPQEPECILRNGDFLEHVMHRHEPPVHFSAVSPSSSPAAGFVHHDEDEVVVVNKPSSISVHPSGAYLHNSMTLLLQRECDEIPELFPVHRLDRLTSGLLMLSKSAAKAKVLCDEIASGQVQKHYVARVLGEFPVVTSSREGDDTEPQSHRAFDRVMRENDGGGLAQIAQTQLNDEAYWSVSAPIGCVNSAEHLQGVVVNESSKSAQTLMKRLSFDGSHSVVECLPITGRTHQIRVHLKFLGFPIVNDPQYGPDEKVPAPGSEAMNGVHETEPTQSESASDHIEEQRSGTDIDKSDEATKCESICTACRDGESAIFSSVQQYCFTLWLHSFKYESAKWVFEVPLPSWALLK